MHGLRNRMAATMAALALLLTLASALFLSLWGCYSRTTRFQTDASGQIVAVHRACTSFIDENGAVVLVWLFLPALLAAAGLWASFQATLRTKLLMWAAAVATLLFSLVTIYSIGILYAAGGLALLAASALAKVRPSPPRAAG